MQVRHASRAQALLVTGSSGLVGSAIVDYFSALGWRVHGVDNNMRADFLGPDADTRWNEHRLQETHPEYRHHEIDVRNRPAVMACVQEIQPNLVVHAAAQPSHDLSVARPLDTFDVNTVGTVNLLEAVRLHAPAAAFVNLSTNKVYGDTPNDLEFVELPKRWEYREGQYRNGIPETFPIDQSTHSVFGASKVAADVMVQEYGRYFNLKTCCLRGGCLTGANQSAR
jgi:CDP-paratose 2-epimerase